MTACADPELLGRWRIVELDGFDMGYIAMLGSAHLRFDVAGGHIAFGVVQLALECSYSATVVHFDFQGSDEGTKGSGDGDADLAPDGTLSGGIRFHHGDDLPFVARRWPVPAAC